MASFSQLKRLLLLVDIVLDIVTAVVFYQEGSYVPLGVFILILLGSSLLVQAYSWFWQSKEYSREEDESRNSPGSVAQEILNFLHGFHLGINVRHLELSKMFFSSNRLSTFGGKHMNQNMALLRVVEMFSESLPELVLMITINLQRGHLVPITVLKAVVKICSASYCVMSYYCMLRSFIPEKYRQSFSSSVVYFLWNLFLISARVAALALFASELPRFVFGHFVCSWMLLFFCARHSRISFMKSKCGEWLHRATLGLIWYFNWFSVRGVRPLLYHCYILTDITLLCHLWFWKKNPDLPNFNYEHAIAYVCIFFYIFGLLCKAAYFKYLHPHVPIAELIITAPKMKRELTEAKAMFSCEPQYEVSIQSMARESETSSKSHLNSVMKQLLVDFFS